MTALEDAARAVDEARERLVGTALAALPNAPGWEKAERAAADLIAAVRLHDTELARAEALHDNTGTPEDEAYNQAIGDAANAIAAHGAKEQT